MTWNTARVALICSLLSGCVGATTGPQGTMGTESFIANALDDYGVLDGRRVDQAAPDPAM